MGRLIITMVVLCCLAAACQKTPTDNRAASSDTAGDGIVRAEGTTRSAEDGDAVPAAPELVMRGLSDEGGLADVNEPFRYTKSESGLKAVSIPGPGVNRAPKAEIRFIRLEHSGKAWDDGMTAQTGRADLNFLEYFRNLSGFTIRQPESIPIAMLKLYKPGQAPPFVFLTGQSLGGITVSDCTTLRQYCKEGGLIFASNGGGSFDHDFRELMKRTFPDQPLAEIPADDPILREPYVFPADEPWRWSPGSTRALGVRAPGTSRLCVFYFPGDLHDAWKAGHSGLSQDKAITAYKLGVNVVAYAVTNYIEMHEAK